MLSGSIVEVWEYADPNYPESEFDPDNLEEKEPEEKEPDKADNLRRANVRAREMIRRLATCNFHNGQSFITITYAENMMDIEESNKNFKQFIQRLKRKYGEFHYLAVIEFQERGAIHYHMLCTLKFEWNSQDEQFELERKLGKIWRHGFVFIKKIRHVDHLGAYIVKYMTKQHDAWLAYPSKKRYLSSKLPVRPEVIKDPETVLLYLDSLEGVAPVITSSYYGEHTGKVIYRQYNPNRKG